MVFHNRGDKIIPFRQGQAMFEAANEPKQAHFYDSGDHVNFDWNEIARKIEAFLVQDWIEL